MFPGRFPGTHVNPATTFWKRNVDDDEVRSEFLHGHRKSFGPSNQLCLTEIPVAFKSQILKTKRLAGNDKQTNRVFHRSSSRAW